MGKSLNDIKSLIALLTLQIEYLDPASKHAAIVHLEEAIGLLKIRAEHDLETLENQNLKEEMQESKLKDDSSSEKQDTAKRVKLVPIVMKMFVSMRI